MNFKDSINAAMVLLVNISHICEQRKVDIISCYMPFVVCQCVMPAAHVQLFF